MPIPSAVVRLSLLGHLQSSEQFDTSFWVLGGGSSREELQDLVDAVADIFTASGAFDQTLSLIPSDCGYDEVRGYSYPEGGPGSTWAASADLGLVGTGTTSDPYQTCVVLSLRTSQIGRSRRGRMYLPAIGVALAQDHQMTPTLTSDLADEWQAIFVAVDAISLETGGNPSVVVVSQTLGDTLIMNRIVVDSKPDIQRRRANKTQASSTESRTVVT